MFKSESLAEGWLNTMFGSIKNLKNFIGEIQLQTPCNSIFEKTKNRKMKQHLFFLLITAVGFSLSCSNRMSRGKAGPGRDGGDTRITVLSYNIHHANPPSK